MAFGASLQKTSFLAVMIAGMTCLNQKRITMKKKNYKYNDLTNLVLFPAEETLKAEKGNFWSGAEHANKTNTRKQKETFVKVDSYRIKDDDGNDITFSTYIPNL